MCGLNNIQWLILLSQGHLPIPMVLSVHLSDKNEFDLAVLILNS